MPACLLAYREWILKDNPDTWNQHAHLLFIDQPAGVGLSSFSAAHNGYADNGTVLGHDVATALVRFFDLHEDLASNPLYIFGESCEFCPCHVLCANSCPFFQTHVAATACRRKMPVTTCPIFRITS